MLGECPKKPHLAGLKGMIEVAVKMRIRRMLWKANGKDMGMHDSYCYRIDEILEDMEGLDNNTYWCITDKFHDYMNHAVHQREQKLVNYLFQLHNEGLDTFDLLDLYDDMRKNIASLLPKPRHKHDYTNSMENIYTMVLNCPVTPIAIYTTISRN